MTEARKDILSDSAERDYRIDVFRGIALLMIFIDHVELLNGRFELSRYTLLAVGLCDATEVFVFISGYACGISYWPVISNSGFVACQSKAIKRALRLWVANLVTLWLVINIAMFSYNPRGANFAAFRLEGLSGPVSLQIARVVLQLYQPVGFDVLTLYMHLILVLPIFLLGVSQHPRLTWFVVIGIYVAVQFFTWFNYPRYDFDANRLSGTARAFNHFAWQLLYFSGCTLSMWRTNLQGYFAPKFVVVVSLIVVIGVGFSKHATFNSSERLANGAFHQVVRTIVQSPFASKFTEGPIRVAYFCMLAVVVLSFVPEKLCPLARRLLHPIDCCGRNSLPAFCLGIFLTYAAHPILIASADFPFALLICDFLGCVLLCLLGIVLSQRRAALSKAVANDSNANNK